MELPKNITQIGEVRKDTKVYAEDYVVSYMKQLNRQSQDRQTAVALYGRREEEDGVLYYFLYGACRLNLLQREVRHLSQAQNQEIERMRRKYFPDYTFLGYRLLDGEMIEGFHIYEQEICRYIAGYAQFYEKNDPMLNYMLEVRKDAQPEQVDREKYEEVRKRQEERRTASEKRSDRILRERAVQREKRTETRPEAKTVSVTERLERMRFAAAGVFVILCLIGFVMLQQNSSEKQQDNLRETAKNWVDRVLDRQLPKDADAVPATGAASSSKDVLVMEDKLEQALLTENQEFFREGQAATESEAESRETDQTVQEELRSDLQPEEQPAEQPEIQPEEESKQQSEEQPAENPAEAVSGPAVSEEPVVPAAEPKQEAVAYVVRMGDTLTAISVRQYGSDARVSDICVLNQISNPDDIKEGQVIMLPK